jgi:hypothetical protein
MLSISWEKKCPGSDEGRQAEFDSRQAEGREMSLSAVIETANSVPGPAKT